MPHTQFIFVFLVVEFHHKRMDNLILNVVCFSLCGLHYIST